MTPFRPRRAVIGPSLSFTPAPIAFPFVPGEEEAEGQVLEAPAGPAGLDEDDVATVVVGPEGAEEAEEEEEQGQERSSAEKATVEQALVTRATEVCGTCAYWLPDQSCAKVDGLFDYYDRCLRFWEPKVAEEGEESDEEAGEAVAVVPVDQA